MDHYYLNHLMGCYFNQDYDLSGETIPEIMQCYLDSEAHETIHGLLKNIENFTEKSDNIESDFEDLYHYDFSPKLWGITATEFLNMISAQATKHLQK